MLAGEIYEIVSLLRAGLGYRVFLYVSWLALGLSAFCGLS